MSKIVDCGKYPCGCNYTTMRDENGLDCCFHYVDPDCRLDRSKIGKVLVGKNDRIFYRYTTGAKFDD